MNRLTTQSFKFNVHSFEILMIIMASKGGLELELSPEQYIAAITAVLIMTIKHS